MRINLLALSLLLFIASCSNETATETTIQEAPAEEAALPTFQNKAHELIYNMTQKVGDYNQLKEKKDVVYTYTYTTADGKVNVSTEKYLFDGELSYGTYSKHERTFPDLEGNIEQAYDGNEYWLKNNDTLVTEEKRLKGVTFSRHTNLYWFCMMQKLTDPGVNYEHLGEAMVDSMNYDIVKISFNAEDGKVTDIYQVYINKETLLIDQFLFTVADFGKMETPFLMKVTYENVDGISMPTQRKYKGSDWNAVVTEGPWVTAIWSDIKFNNGLTAADFKK